MKKIKFNISNLLIISGLIIFLAILNLLLPKRDSSNLDVGDSYWPVQSIDTMKYSRDIAREKLNDTSFDETIETQVKNIALTGATHIAVATPYDAEFIPFLERWVEAARENDLNVWFRGNFSGWEKWFGYEKISREEHINKTEEFILKNPNLFEDGDIFTSCPECENGGTGDPRRTRDVEGFRNFLIEEYEVSNAAFQKIGRKVKANYFSMNGDVAELIMDKKTTSSLNGIVVIDHYVATPEKLVKDIRRIAEKSGGKIVLGEFGAPIPDIHGDLNEQEQLEWIQDALALLSAEESLVGVNYWLSLGGRTALWNSDNTAKLAVKGVTQYFTPIKLEGVVVNELGRPIVNVDIQNGKYIFTTNKNGKYAIKTIPSMRKVVIKAEGFLTREIDIKLLFDSSKIVMVKKNEGYVFKFLKSLFSLIV